MEKLSNRQKTFSKKKCIEKYGYKIGTLKWKQRQIKWQNTMNNKSDEEKRRINKLKVNGSLKNFKKFNISKAEIELCYLLNGESQFLIENDDNSFYLYDIKIGENKLIEYNGDYWHCNPNKWKANNFNKSIQMYAKDKWYKDRIKIENAKNKGYDILVIWEEEWKADKNKVIQKCKEFINDN